MTTHSLEEAENLAQRIGIMVHGRLRCIGTLAHLRNKFGQGFQIEIKCHSQSDADNLLETLRERLHSIEVLSQFFGTLRLRVRDADASLASLFALMEDLKRDDDNKLEAYAVSHTTLEQVFLNFAKQSED